MHATPIGYLAASRIPLAGLGAALCLAIGGISDVGAGGLTKASWFPDPPKVTRFVWEGEACQGCIPLAPREEWEAMAELAGLGNIRFLLAPGESGGHAWSTAPNVVVLSPSALKLPECQLAFVVGHELVHIAQRHFDEDANDLLMLSGKPANWTRAGETVMSMLDGDFSLVLRMSPVWQQQEQEADWAGSLLAAQACGCNLEQGALPYLSGDIKYGGGPGAAHSANTGRIKQLKVFAESARKLSRHPE